MDVNVYGDTVVSIACKILSRKGSVMVWGGISIDGRTDLVVVRDNLTAAGYIEQILLQHVLVAACDVGSEFELMHDNARAHVARITRAVLR
jgi:hypothetical protein